uniref:TIR domain-containing protein n=1 Tax=Tetranychus urticae TaxID=32264 RepID=T1L3S4_TETUR
MFTIFGGVNGLVLNYNTGNPSGDDVRPSPHHTSSDSWVSEELWPKEKSIIHIKLIKPVPKEISIRESRDKDYYLTDTSLDFDSPYRTLFQNNCAISFKSYYDGFTSEPNNQEISREVSSIQVQITGGIDCKELPLSLLTPFAANLTHLVVKDTGITNLTKFLFGAYRLDKLIRLDLISNSQLVSLQSRAFDGLTRLSYLSLINNNLLTEISLESFAGLKSLEELIFLGNGPFWDQSYFLSILRASSDKILPNLIHLHLCGAKVVDVNNTNINPSDVNNLEKIEYIYNEMSTNHSVPIDGHKSNDDAVKSRSVLLSVLRSSDSEAAQENGPTSVNKPGVVINWKRNNNHKSGLKINKDDFQALTQVKYLQLSDCDITYIHPLALAPLARNIISLNLAGNPKLRIHNLNPTNIGLNMLDLSNSLSTSFVPKDLLTVISKTTITELYMANVPWKVLREGDIPPMPNLKVLHIDSSQIETVDEKAFDGLEDLRKLSLRGNLIQEIPLYLLEPFRELEYLDLSGYQNEIARYTPLNIPRKAFVHRTHLKELNLSYKNLTQLPRYLFMGLFKMEKLHLRGCNLQSIEYLTFFPLKSIIYIDLSENPQLISNVRTSEEDTFVGLEAIEMIRLSNCNLTSDDINDFNIWRRMHEHVQMLDLSHNSIDLINSTTLQNFAELRHINLSHNKIKSWHNYTIFGKNSFITTLDISANQITHITAEMLGDFRNLKNLSFAFNPLQCECDWDGPLLLLDQKQKRLNHVHHAKIQDHIQQLVHRQQEIVSTAFASSQAPPKSIIEWLNTTSIHFLHDHHPLRSNRHYFCQSKSPLEPPIVFKKFFYHDCPSMSSSRSSARVSVGILMVTVSAALLLAVFFLIIAFIYNSTIRNLLSMVDDDFLHSYQYDAFVCYNVNDSDWVFNVLVPSLEELPYDEHFDSSHSSVKFNQSSSTTITSTTLPSTDHPAKSHVKLCVYDRDFIAGRPISECITESIRNSRKVILIISNNFAQSPWCRFETDLAHNTLLDQNREGLILIKLEEMSSEVLEKVAPQLHFLLKTRIYLSWSDDSSEQEIFWKKLRRALGFNKSYGTVKQYYRSYVGGLTKDRRPPGFESTQTPKIVNTNQTGNHKEEVYVSFTRKTLSASRDINDLDEITVNDHDSGIAVVDDSGCVSVNGDDTSDDVLEFIVDQRNAAEDNNTVHLKDNEQNNLDQETKRRHETKDKSGKIQSLNVVVDKESEELRVERFVSLEMDS